MGTVKWTYEACYNVAKECISRIEFKKKHACAYYAALKNHWIDNYTWFKPLTNFWTYEACYNEASKYSIRSRFKKGSYSAYVTACRNKWMKDYTWFKPTGEVISEAQKGLHVKWTYEVCFELAKEYTSRIEFQNGCVSAYAAAARNHWLDNYTWFKTTSEIRTKWTKEVCFDLAKNCDGRSDFYKKYGRAYQVSLKNGWIEEMFPLSFDAYENCDNVYRYYFNDFNAIYVGRTIRPKRRDREHIFQVNKDPVAKFAHEHDIPVPPMEILVSNIALREGQRLEGYYIDLYREQGYTILNKAKAGSLGAIKLKR